MLDLPFKLGKKNVAPDDSQCLKCGKCCTSYEGVPLSPDDFKGEDMESELRQLMTLDVLLIGLSMTGYEVCIHQNYKCPFLKDSGCVMPPDQRPIGCRLYGPDVGAGKGKPNKCGSLLKSGKDLIVEWEPHSSVLAKIYDELPENKKKLYF